MAYLTDPTRDRRMPTLYRIQKFWLRVDTRRYQLGLDPIYPSNFEDDGEPSCAACGWRVPASVERDLPDNPTESDWKMVWRHAEKWLDRAHLMDRSLGGPDIRANLVPMCHVCHDDMPPFDTRADALKWIASRPHCPPWWQLATEYDSPITPANRHEMKRTWRSLTSAMARGQLIPFITQVRTQT